MKVKLSDLEKLTEKALLKYGYTAEESGVISMFYFMPKCGATTKE